MRRSSVVLVACAALAGCGGTASSAGEFEGEQRAVAQVLEDLQTAGERRDTAKICDELLSAELVTRLKAGGADCRGELRDAVRDTEDTELDVKSVKVSGQTATATVESREGERTRTSTFTLRRERGRWRVTALDPGR